MTKWFPTPAEGLGPYYLRLADSIESAIADGSLSDGYKLPPQRHLAFDLKVTIGTVGRAYALLRERGLVSGEVGRGTYVLNPDTRARTGWSDSTGFPLEGTRVGDAPPDKIRFDTTAPPEVGQGAIVGALFAEIARDHPAEIASYSRSIPSVWLEAGAEWLARNGWRPSPEDIVPTHGAHAAAMAVIAAVTSPGEKVAFETLTYSHISRSTRLIGRRCALVETDDHGMIPEDFERVCAQQHPKAAFLMPTLHNPLLTIMPEARRRAVADIARHHGVWLIEDDLYGSLSGDGTPLVASFAPERTFLVGGLSKSVAAGVRGGWVACPPHFTQRIKATHKMMTGGLSFILAEAGARLVTSGAAADLRRRSREEIAAREATMRQVFAGCDFASHPHAPFLWLKLPEPWLSGTFKNAAFGEGILIDDEDEFKADRLDRSYHRARIGFSSADRATVIDGFARLRRLLDSGNSCYDGEI